MVVVQFRFAIGLNQQKSAEVGTQAEWVDVEIREVTQVQSVAE